MSSARNRNPGKDLRVKAYPDAEPLPTSVIQERWGALTSKRGAESVAEVIAQMK